MNFKYIEDYEKFYLECLEEQKINIIDKCKNYLIEENHLILYSEEPNILGKY